MPEKNRRKWTRVIPNASQALVLLCVATLLLYPIAALANARREGVFRTPEEGVAAIASRWYCGFERVEIEEAVPNSSEGLNQHIWYVIYRVYARSRPPCDQPHPGSALVYGTYERGGNYYLDTRVGWVMRGEGNFPEYIGAWMKVFGLAGPGDTTPVHPE